MTPPCIKRINPFNPNRSIMEEASGILNRDGIVVAPTETRYGLLGRADHPVVMEKIYFLKNRPKEMPTAVFVHSKYMISEFADETDISISLAERFLPGPLTLVLKAHTDFGAPIVINGKIGIRCSSSRIIAAVIERVSFPVCATSANLSGREEPTTIEEIAKQFGGHVDMYLDAGPLDGQTSTVVDCSGDDVQILRRGAVGDKEINLTVGRKDDS